MINNRQYKIIYPIIKNMTQYGYENQSKKKNEVTESMISTVSEAFEFQDFLGQKTTLKDRVPKNKANLDKKIVHYSREVTQDKGLASNSLSNYNPGTSFQNKTAFENYMSDDYYGKPKQQSSPVKSQQSKPSYQSSTYYPPQSTYYDNTKYSNYSSSYSHTPSTSSPYSSGLANPEPQGSYQSPYSSTSKLNTGYGNNYATNEGPTKNHYHAQNQSSFSKPINSYNTYSQQQNNYSTNFQSYSYKEPSLAFSKSYVDDRNNWAAKSAGITSTADYSYAPSSSSYYSNPQPSYAPSSYSYKPYQPSTSYKPYQPNYEYVNNNNTYYDRSYDNYGDYAKDFSSPDIMAILNKRKKTEGNQGYSTKI